MKNKSEKIYHFLSFACMVALAAYIILFLHHLLTESASYMSGATYKYLVGAELVLLIIVFIKDDFPTLDFPTSTISGSPFVGYCFGLTADISIFGSLINIYFPLFIY